MGPTPVGVEDDRVVLGRAAVRARAPLHRQLRVRLGGERAGPLAVRDRRVGESEERDDGEHCTEEVVWKWKCSRGCAAVEDKAVGLDAGIAESEAGFIPRQGRGRIICG